MTENKKPILNKVKIRSLILSPTVKEGLEREANKTDFYREGDKPIGKGGFGEVWKVIHKSTNKLYCIKVINKRSIIEQKMVEQMNREIEIMYSLNHPHVVKLINHFEDDDSFYLVMNYASKGQLYSHLKRSGKFEQRIAAQYLRETIEALMYLHNFHPPIIHRDIKPENILLDENYRVKLADFGWSNYENSSAERKTYCGTPEYLAPEMLSKKGHDTSVDIWSIGILMFELLCGKSPFAGRSPEELFNNIRDHRMNWPRDFPPLAKNLVSLILKQNPKERITLKEVLNHMWFQQNPPIYKPLEPISNDRRKILESHLLSEKPENCQKEISKVMEKINNLRLTRNTITNNDSKIINPNFNNINNINNKNFNISANFNENNTNSNNYISEKMNVLNKENTDIKKNIEILANELLKAQQAKEINQKQNEIEISSLKNELDKYIKLNKERINILAELEDKNNKLIELDCKVKSLNNEIVFLKESNDDFNKKNNELKDNNKKLEEKNAELKRKLFDSNANNEEIISDLQKKLEILQTKIFEGNSSNNYNFQNNSNGNLRNSDYAYRNNNNTDNNNSSDFNIETNYSSNSSSKSFNTTFHNNNMSNKENFHIDNNNLNELINESINEFKKIFNTKISHLIVVLGEIKEEFALSEASIKSNIENKHSDMQDLISKLTKKFDSEMEKLNDIDNIINNNDINKKSNKENWLSDQLKELLPYKTKFLSNEAKIKKYENEILIMNDRFKTVDELYCEVKKINGMKNDELRLKENQIATIENKLCDIKDFVIRSCPDKLDELSEVLKQ